MIPRVVIAGTSSGAGKTTVACGLIGALRERGTQVQGFKVGPDYIDPSHHALASGRPGRNLDAFLSGPELIAPLVRHGSQGAEVAVIEGVMGMFDGVSGRGELASTAHVAKLLRAPVLLVVDAAAMARSAAAIVHGYRTFDPDVNVAGVIFNRVGSDHHEQLLREALADLSPPLPVLGALRRDERIATPERHLGLVPAGEREAAARAALGALAEAMARYTDLDAIERIARGAPELAGATWSAWPAETPGAGAGGGAPGTGAPGAAVDAPAGVPRIALAAGPAFSFHYEENLELLRAAGAELAPFDPISDEALPEDASALLLAGGFPEVYGAELEANAQLRAQVAAFAASGRPVLAECGGLLYLAQELDGHEMCGALPVRARMSERLTLGYREAVAASATPWLDAGERVRGHEFHYTQVEPAAAVGDSAFDASTRGGTGAPPGLAPAWTLLARGKERTEGYAAGGVQASYLHVHWAAHPELARRFAHAARTAPAAQTAAA
ncbi:MAG TPA: cobyrinate a,c-diamide synthase [Solirubrobacteraceae bacterium]|nr:cobyrinate a,c-diamide synthase [Solirubrobacteraceae bacterium]